MIMGVYYQAVAMYGKYFDTRGQISEFVKDIYPDAEVDYEGVYEVPLLVDIQIETLNAYSGNDLILGYRMKLGELIDTYKAKWDAAFPNNIEDAEAHLEVGIY